MTTLLRLAATTSMLGVLLCFPPSVVLSSPAPFQGDPDSVMYRTATYQDWAYASDGQYRFRAIKPRPHATEFTLRIRCDADDVDHVEIQFGSLVFLSDDYKFPPAEDALEVTPLPVDVEEAGSEKDWVVDFSPPLNSGDTVTIHGAAWNWTSQKVRRCSWYKAGQLVSSNRAPVSTENLPLLPMPNLHNVGEGVFGGMAHTPMEITIGAPADPKGAHTVYLSNYKDVQKTLIRPRKGFRIFRMHAAPPRWLDVFDRSGMPILKAQKGLSAEKHDNMLLGEQLALKLNLAASDSGIFPKGLGDLIYSNGTPFDGMSVWEIALHVDTFLTHGPHLPMAVTDPDIYHTVVTEINNAFRGPMDTISWSGGKVICTGVKMLSEVPYLSAPPANVPSILHQGSPLIHVDRPASYALEQNYPNPFNPTTTIGFELVGEALVSVTVYDMLGQEVALLADREPFDEGTNDLTFDASGFPSGVYFYRIVAQELEGARLPFTSVKRMVLIK